MSCSFEPSRDIFLLVRPGDFIFIQGNSPSLAGEAYWLAHVIHASSGARNHRSNSIFQVLDLRTGCIKIINADLVKAIFRTKQ